MVDKKFETMISISKYIGQVPDEGARALLRVPYVMLEALVAHSVEYDPSKYEANRATLRKIRNDLEIAKTGTDVLQATGAIVRAIETYNRGVSRYISDREEERKSADGLLMGKMLELAKGKGASAEKLRNIGQKLAKAVHGRDIRILKDELAESLQSVREEATHQQEQSDAITIQTLELMNTSGHSGASLVDSDPATGLPSMQTAELALQQAIGSRVHAYLVLFTVALGSITRRYGDGHHDAVLASFAKQIAAKLPRPDPLFRWKGPALVAILERPDLNDTLPPEIAKMSTFRPEFTLEIDGKSTKIQLSMSSISIHLWKYDNLNAVQQILAQCQSSITPDPA